MTTKTLAQSLEIINLEKNNSHIGLLVAKLVMQILAKVTLLKDKISSGPTRLTRNKNQETQGLLNNPGQQDLFKFRRNFVENKGEKAFEFIALHLKVPHK